MILSDFTIRKLKTDLVYPFDFDCVQPSSYDLALDDTLAIPIPGRKIDMRVDEPRDHMEFVQMDKEKGFLLSPGACVLGATRETVKCPLNLSCRVEGKSSIGRLFVAIHVTAGVIDAGFEGQVTLEIVNHGPWDVVLYPKMKIAQLSYFQMDRECYIPYGSTELGSHYKGQRGPTPAAGKRGDPK